MNVFLAQVQSEPGHVAANVGRHVAALSALAPDPGDLVAFPELSLSNYDPTAAVTAAVAPDDDRLAPLQRAADDAGCVVVVGAPLRTAGRPCIAALVFTAGRGPLVVGKRHLHPDEHTHFSPYEGEVGVLDLARRVGLAICFEVSVPGHAAAAARAGVEVYLASAAKTADGVTAAQASLAETSRRHALPALLVNSVGTCEGKEAGGRSFALDASGRLLGQLGGSDEGALVYDAERQAVAARLLR